MDDRRVTITVCPDFQRRRCRRHLHFGDPPARYKFDRYSRARSLQPYCGKKLEALWRGVICCQDYFGLAITVRQASDRNATVSFPIGSDTVDVRGYGLLRIQDENERVENRYAEANFIHSSSVAAPARPANHLSPADEYLPWPFWLAPPDSDTRGRCRHIGFQNWLSIDSRNDKVLAGCLHNLIKVRDISGIHLIRPTQNNLRLAFNFGITSDGDTGCSS